MQLSDYSRMSKKQLCDVLEVKPSKAIKFIFTNKETGDELKFHSMNQASKELKVNPGLISLSYYIGKKMTITTYSVVKL